MLAGLFDQIFIVNLPSRPDRLRELQEQLLLIGCSLKDPKVQVFPAVRPDNAGSFPSIGARGCFLSHLGIIKAAAEHNYRRILILEDDCNFVNFQPADLASLVSGLGRRNWAFFYGGALNSDIQMGRSDDASLGELAASEGVLGTHCVGVDGSVLRSLAEYLERMMQRPDGDPEGGPMHVDGAYSWFRRAHPHLLTLIARPEIAYQRSSRTDIGQTRWFDRVLGVKSVVAALRVWKNRNKKKNA